jgi:hypothetical protein
MKIRERIARFVAPELRNEAEIRNMVAEEVQRAKMALPITVNYDPKNEGYRRLSDTQQRRDLHPLDQSRMFEIAYFMFDSSAMTKRLAKLDKTFIFAEPITITADDEKVKEIIDRFWTKNKMDMRLPDRIMWLGMLGEQCWPVIVNQYNGEVSLKYADPSQIKDVWVNPLDVEDIMMVDLLGTSGIEGRRLKAIHEDTNPASRTMGLLVGDCFFYSINHPLNSPRGRSDFLTLFDWIDSLERYGYNYLERAEFLLNFIWDVTLKGMNEDQVRKWLQDNPVPQPGSMRAHNENVEWNAVAPDLKATDFTSGFDMAKGYIMGSAGRPSSWFGEGGKAYQTEADQFGQVPIKDLDERQLYVKYILQEIIQFVVDQAVIAGRLPAEKRDVPVIINMPEISKKDTAKITNAIPQIATALTMAENSKWIRKETATKIFAAVAGQMGVEIDVEAEIEGAGKMPPEDMIDYDKL